ncbi:MULTISPECIES: glycine cleavage system aminomethyltransferase GcvT [Prauserella salsuginis group]|uniref:Aminomethyltransferase n=1 Tax=Prauserella salsuginis TaxID=387889 RepID=A0ABW6G4V8_9PSEU|nr:MULTISPECIES: glycine cleavage system aminomethyltransferase GcvT [Prauserella salsuginis group]MCR3718795.1 aminomethyltransferase [Prauserella flava]MCR3733365.1 aminomethyltransferase [Prauserella salsuginis]
MKTPLHDVHSGLGASFTDFAGWDMPVRYSSDLAEHRAVREASGLFDLSHMGEIELAGPQAADALDYAFSGKLSAVAVGRARYTMMCNERGGVVDDLVVYRLAEERYLVVANAGNAAEVSAELVRRAEGFDTTVTDRSAETALIAVQGPTSAAIVGAVSDADLSTLKYYASVPTTVAGRDVLLARTGYTGEDGFELFVAADDAAAVWQVLTEAGQGHGIVPCGLACRDTLRLEAGMPLYGNELSADGSPFAANLGRVVRFDKEGDFVGRAALEGRPAPETVLVGLTGSGRRAPRHGYRVLQGDDEVGEITSGALSPTLGHPIAMAYVPVRCSEPGTTLSADIRGRLEPVEVVALPFYQRR